MSGNTRAASEVTPRPVKWLWPDRIPRGKVTLLDGDPGLGKTTVLLDVSACVSTGRPMPGVLNGCDTEPRGVLYLSAEDDDGDTLRPRLEAAEADLGRVYLWNATSLPTLPSGAGELEALASELNLALIVLDPGVAFIDGDLNTNNDAQVRQALAPLRGICEDTGCATVLLRHLNKDSKGSNPLYRGGGSIAFIGAARSGLLAARSPDDPDEMVLAHIKANVGPRAGSLAYQLKPVEVNGAGSQVRVEWLGASDYAAADLLQSQRQNRSPARSECSEWLRERINESAVAFKLLATEGKRHGWGERLLQRAGDDLGVVSQRTNVQGAGTLWSLP